MDLGLTGKVAAVGGASKGIGKAAAIGLAAEGCRVAICARGEEALAETRQQLEAMGAEVLAMPCDMSNGEDIARFIKATVDRFGRLDIVVNNQGGPPYGPFEMHDEAAWLQAFNQSFMAAVRVATEALPHMKAAGGGRIINVASTSMKQPIDGMVLSNSMRAGVGGLAKTMSREFGKYNITVNTVNPGATLTARATELYRQRAEQTGRSIEEMIAESGKAVPLGHVGMPEDVAALIVFLAGEPARHITGTAIAVDGGETTAVF